MIRASVIGLSLLLAGSAVAVSADEVFPTKGNEVVIYSHHFKPENFNEGLKLVKEGFTNAQAKMGQTRHNYFLVNPETHDVVVVSFFGKDESVDEWHAFVGRAEVLQKLQPMRRSPMDLERFTVDAITDTP